MRLSLFCQYLTVAICALSALTSVAQNCQVFPPEFTADTIAANVAGATAVHAADLDQDGDMDVIAAAYTANAILWYEQEAAGRFREHLISSDAMGARAVFVADINNDGHLDILSASEKDNKIAWYEHDGDGQFTERIVTTAASRAVSVYAADLNQDTHMDIVAAAIDAPVIYWYENDGSENFKTRTIPNPGQVAGVTSVHVADLNGDKRPDILATSAGNNSINWYPNNGNGSFDGPSRISASAIGATAVFSADVNSDGYLDVLSASLTDNKIAWYENNGSAVFSERVVSRNAVGATSVFAADLDSDGNMDILSTAAGNNELTWYQNNGSQTFRQITLSERAELAAAVYAADLDQDDRIDILSASYGNNSVLWYKNETFLQENDQDGDGLRDDIDNCPFRANPGLNFDGQDDYLSFPDHAAIWSPQQGTIEYWFQMERAGASQVHLYFSNYGNIWGDGFGSGAGKKVLEMHTGVNDNNEFVFIYEDGTDSRGRIYGQNTIQANRWYHCAIVYDRSGTASMYLDGILIGAIDMSVMAFANNPPDFARFGRPGWDQRYFDGTLDELRIWETTRTQEEIQSTMHRELNGDEPGLLAYYRFNERPSGGCNTGPANLVDQSGRGQIAQMKNFGRTGCSSNWTTGPPILHADPDGNGIGGLCDEALGNTPDIDQDGLPNELDNCPNLAGSALSFDGVDDHITFEAPKEIPTGDGAYTVEAWFKADAMGDRGILGWGAYGQTGAVNALRLSADGVRHYWWNNDLDAQTGDLTGQWHHLAATYDGTIRRIYLDGQEVARDQPTAPSIPNASNLAIGKTFGNEYFDGLIDEVRIWSVARTGDDIRAYKDQELSGMEDGLVAYFRFNDGRAGQSNNLASIKDDSPSGNKGDLNNFTEDSCDLNWRIGAPIQFADLNGDGVGDACELIVSDTDEEQAPVFSILQLYPNPAEESVRIDYEIARAGTVHWQLFDLTGRLLQRAQTNAAAGKNQFQIDVQALAPGPYLIRLLDGEGRYMVRKLIVR